MTTSFRLTTRRFGELLIERGRLTPDQLTDALKSRQEPKERLGQALVRLGLISERPRTGYELAQELWGNVAVTQAFLAMSEVIGHLDLLIEQGRARELEEGEVIRFAARVENGSE